MDVFSHTEREAQEEVGKCVERIGAEGAGAVKDGESAGKVEAAAGAIGRLGLEMVDGVIGVLAAKAEGVRAANNAEIGGGRILVVAKQKGVRNVGIADG